MPSATEYLLDTHVWVWLVQGDERRIGVRTRRQLRAAARSGNLRVSPISAWEVGMLVVKGRLRLSIPCAQWVDNATTVPGVAVSALTPAIAVESSALPGAFVGDPADRMLIATARAIGACMITADRAILDYGRAGHLRCEDCTK